MNRHVGNPNVGVAVHLFDASEPPRGQPDDTQGDRLVLAVKGLPLLV